MEQEKKYWMIYVNPTRYNLFGAVREFCDELPWGFMTDDFSVGETVYFYLTGTDGETTEHQMSNAMVRKVFKRFAFKGRIKEVLDGIDKRDEKYWTDNHDKEQGKHYALIEITDYIYDKKILSEDLKEFSWGKTATLEIDLDTVRVIENKINEKERNRTKE